VAAVVLVVVARVGAPRLFLDGDVIALGTGIVAALLILLWWTFFSRAPWVERLGALVAMAASILVIWRMVDKSIATGMMGGLLPMFSLQAMTVALVGWAVVTRQRSSGVRRVSMVLVLFVACASLTLVRTAGVGGGTLADFHWRWTPTPEDRLLAAAAKEAPLPSPVVEVRAETPSVLPAPAGDVESKSIERKERARAESVPASGIHRKPADWPGFRGADRNGVVRGVNLATDWSATPPTVLWRRPIGPGWSSFAVDGDLLYTQEQRGDEELVAAYWVSSGEPVWRHRDAARFWESNGGAGPRGTPTLSDGRVYSFGATGILNALDARTGAVIWSRNAAADSTVAVPMWGFASSPLVMDDEVIVAASGKLAAYDLVTGAPRWLGPDGGNFSYSSPQRVTLGGVPQVLLLAGNEAISVAPATGKLLWKHTWAGGAIVQPAVTGDGDVLIHTLAPTGGNGIRRLAVAQRPDGWSVQERWTSTGLKPYYDDFVVHKGFAFGADGSILACIDLTDGTRKWKGGRYGPSQLLLLPDQDLLLVLSEEGELALVSALPDQFKELAHIPALDGKTWNHPVIVRDILLVRNGEEMAAFRLPTSH
jgi:outer membrane protein assembly factor BamB